METMNNTIQAVGSEPAAFVLSPLKSTDVWQMVRILKRIDIMGAVKSIDPKLLEALDYKKPTMMQDGEEVPLPEAQWTKAQKKAHEKAQEATDRLLWSVLEILMENIGACEDDVNKMLATGIGKDLAFIRSMPANDYIDLIAQFITREEFADFFMHAAKLLKKMGSSRSSIANAVTSMR